MSSKEASQEEDEETKKESLDSSGRRKRQNPRILPRYSSSNDRYSSFGESVSSDIETEDDAASLWTLGAMKQRRRRKLGSLYARPSQQNNRTTMQDMTMVDDDLENFEEEEPSHLTSLVSLKKAVDNYANKLVRTQDNEIPPSGKVTAGATYDATPAEIKEGKIKATQPTPQIKLSADHGISDEQLRN